MIRVLLLALAALAAAVAAGAATANVPPLATCASADHEVAIYAKADQRRPVLLTPKGAKPLDAKYTRRDTMHRLSATSVSQKLFLAVQLHDDGSDEILYHPMGGDSLRAPATCTGREALITYLEAQP